MEEAANSNKKEIEEKKQKKSEKDRNGIFGGMVFAIIFLMLTYNVHRKFSGYPIGNVAAYILGSCTFVCFVVALSCYFDYKESKKIEQLEDEAKIEEKEFSNINPEERGLRAEKLFRINQKQLMRYYDMNLAQTKFLSGLGILMIFFGMMIVLATMYLYFSFGVDKSLLYTGSLSGIVFDFIGAVFIKMYTKNIEAAVKFHSQFADSNSLLLANSIANKIDTDELREETLAEISKSIGMHRRKVAD